LVGLKSQEFRVGVYCIFNVQFANLFRGVSPNFARGAGAGGPASAPFIYNNVFHAKGKFEINFHVGPGPHRESILKENRNSISRLQSRTFPNYYSTLNLLK
jgi:hypothetical protein